MHLMDLLHSRSVLKEVDCLFKYCITIDVTHSVTCRIVPCADNWKLAMIGIFTFFLNVICLVFYLFFFAACRRVFGVLVVSEVPELFRKLRAAGRINLH